MSKDTHRHTNNTPVSEDKGDAMLYVMLAVVCAGFFIAGFGAAFLLIWGTD